MNTLSKFVFLYLFLFVSNYLFSQSQLMAIEDVILVNNKPYLVRMTTKGNILTFEREIPDSYAAISRVKGREINLMDVYLPEMVFDENIDNEIAGMEEIVGEEVIVTGAEGEKPTLTYGYDLAFDYQSATLSALSVKQLYQIASLMKSDENLKCSIESFYYSPVVVSKVLSKNRVNAIKNLLVLKEIDASRIKIIESEDAAWTRNRVLMQIN